MKKGNIKVHTQNIFPVIKKWLYSDKDIFLRELVVNGCDAITKMKKLSSLGEAEMNDQPKLCVVCDKEAKTVTISDNGIGMTAEEVEKYITQVAFSGAEEFLEKYKSNEEESQIIGHFGLGFYSAFMVADVVEIDTLSYKGGNAVKWVCDGGTEYEMGDGERKERGTTIVLHISENESEFLEPYRLKSILLKYCGFLPYPIFQDNEENPVNDTCPLWARNPADCSEEQYKELYHRIFSDINDPLFWIHLNVEYPFSLKGILYFPKLTHEFESAEGQIKLFNNQVFVADNIKEVIPEYLMLLKGVIDCPDLPLNVSRSFLQNDGQVNKISVHITKKVADKLVSLHNTEKEQYDTYYDDIAPFIEYGCLRDEKFYDKLKPCLQAKDLDGNFVEITKYAEENNKEITYVSDPKMQVQYIKILKEADKNAIILPHIIDTHFISFLEMKEGYKFTRIDSTPENNEGDEEISKLFSDILGDESLKVTTASLKTNVPAILSEDEQTRRMADITRMFGGGYTAPKTYTLIVNTDSPLTEKVKTIKDEEIKKDICKQIYDIARICHAPLEVDQLAKFIERSTKILEMLADK